MEKLISLQIDGHAVNVPEGTLIVNAARQVGVDIPIFCYHPKMEPVGMCRMCLVDVGRPMIDRATGQPQKEEDGSLKIGFGPKLETACTTPVSEGIVVVTSSGKVAAARKDVLEFLLTSHPLDCPICDKGGECPLQNLTRGYGPGESRYIFDEKNHAAKHVPLGELIYLDRERCIQCARCVRFEKDIAGDSVIDFQNRGRKLEIQTNSKPGFDSIFSGNTTDICPVGALTTADFRFGARPWELSRAASLCSHCPVGCNLIFNVRREARSEGKTVIKRVMPRQNEAVNELWSCDKGRFGYHFTESCSRVTKPLIKKNGKLQPASWDEALKLVIAGIKKVGENSLFITGGSMANEGLYTFRKIARKAGAKIVLHSHMDGNSATRQYGLGPGSNLGTLTKGDAILVAASDLHEEAPIWWLRVKQATQRGVTLVVVSSRETRLGSLATHVIHCQPGEEAGIVKGLVPGDQKKAEKYLEISASLVGALHLVIFFGSDTLGLAGTRVLASACAELLDASERLGKPNNGLVGVWPTANQQGCAEFAIDPIDDLAGEISRSGLVYAAATDPAGDDLNLALSLDNGPFLIVQDLFLTETAQRADIVLPACAYTETEGTFTSGERRVQRFYPVVPIMGESLSDATILSRIGKLSGLSTESNSPAAIFKQISDEVLGFSGLDYSSLAEVEPQNPTVSRKDLYYGGTSYENDQGLGKHLAFPAGGALPKTGKVPALKPGTNEIVLLPVTRLYDASRILQDSLLLNERRAKPEISLASKTMQKLGLEDGDMAVFEINGWEEDLVVKVDENVPAGCGLIARNTRVRVDEPILTHCVNNKKAISKEVKK